MPVLGWAGGRLVAGVVAAFDHWLAFGILAVIGARMIREGLDPDVDRPIRDPSRGWTLVLLSVATSIDALAVGFSLALLDVPIWHAAATIAVVTALLVVLAAWLGARLGTRIRRWAGVVGGVLLIAVGLRILVGHLLG